MFAAYVSGRVHGGDEAYFHDGECLSSEDVGQVVGVIISVMLDVGDATLVQPPFSGGTLHTTRSRVHLNNAGHADASCCLMARYLHMQVTHTLSEST